MPMFVFAVVVAAALLHAAWNAIVKSAGDKFLTTIKKLRDLGVKPVKILPSSLVETAFRGCGTSRTRQFVLT